MKIFNLYGDNWDEPRDREGWRIKEAFVGHSIGGALIGTSMAEVEPGSKLWPYHTHHANEEWVIVLRGEPTLRTPEGEQILMEGDVVCFPRGKDGAHQITNNTEAPIRVLMLSSMIGPDIIEYLDTGKVWATSAEGPIMFARPGPTVEYWKARNSAWKASLVGEPHPVKREPALCQCSGMTPEIPESKTSELHAVAERIALALPAVVEEVVLTGSVSRGVADDLSDVEMLLVTAVRLDLAQCFENAANVGLVDLDTWGGQGTEVARVFGYYEGIPIETIWWPHDFAEESVEALVAGELSMAADALINGVALRTVGLLETWQARLRVYPDAVAAARIEEAAVAWGGFHPTGFLTLARPHERLALIEYLYNDAARVLQIVYALNRVWQPTSKRLADRVGSLAVKPSRLAERIEEALTEPDPLRAMLVMSELQVDTADLAPTGPNIERARRWLREVVAVLREGIDSRAI